ncbi:hypothetical protein DFJ73DRAFT_759620 [Zopfochytrium polystomum]|nr:hypothetical protein DFJ73DRAFT_759620 [Zopfochytrium polystomum]
MASGQEEPTRYTRAFLLALQDSPLVQKPDDLPPIETFLQQRTEGPQRKDGDARPRGNGDEEGDKGMVFGPPKMSFASTRNASASSAENAFPRAPRRNPSETAEPKDESPPSPTGGNDSRRKPLVVGPSSSTTFPRAPRFTVEERLTKGGARPLKESPAADKPPLAKVGEKGPAKVAQAQPRPPPVNHHDGGPDSKVSKPPEPKNLSRRHEPEPERPPSAGRQPAWMEYDASEEDRPFAVSEEIDAFQRFKQEMNKKNRAVLEEEPEPPKPPSPDPKPPATAAPSSAKPDPAPMNAIDIFLAQKVQPTGDVSLLLNSITGSALSQQDKPGPLKADNGRKASRFQGLFRSGPEPFDAGLGSQEELRVDQFSLGPTRDAPAPGRFPPGSMHPDEPRYPSAIPQSENILSLIFPGANQGPPNGAAPPQQRPEQANPSFNFRQSLPPSGPNTEAEIQRQILETLKGKGGPVPKETASGVPLPAGARVYSESDILRMHGVVEPRGNEEERRQQPPELPQPKRVNGDDFSQHGRIQPRPEGIHNPMHGERRFPLEPPADETDINRIYSMLRHSTIQDGSNFEPGFGAPPGRGQFVRTAMPNFGGPQQPHQNLNGVNQQFPPQGNPQQFLQNAGMPNPQMMSRPQMLASGRPPFVNPNMPRQPNQGMNQFPPQFIPGGRPDMQGMSPDVINALAFQMRNGPGASPPLPGQPGGFAGGMMVNAGRPLPQFFGQEPGAFHGPPINHMGMRNGPGGGMDDPMSALVQNSIIAKKGVALPGGGVSLGGIMGREPMLLPSGGHPGYHQPGPNVRLDDVPYGPRPNGYFGQGPMMSNNGPFVGQGPNVNGELILQQLQQQRPGVPSFQQ